MGDATLSVITARDGTLVIRPHGVLGMDMAAELQRALIHAVRHVRPSRLVLDLQDVEDLDPINVGAFAAACGLGDDHRVAVFLDCSSATLADRLAAAGVPRHRLRRIGERRSR
jgi:anti-anti-sigma regulatory factor